MLSSIIKFFIHVKFYMRLPHTPSPDIIKITTLLKDRIVIDNERENTVK
jgi:hypothetical protein